MDIAYHNASWCAPLCVSHAVLNAPLFWIFLHVFGPACIRFLTPIVVTDPEMLLVTSLPAGVAA